jgi:hypothetical protein
VPSINNKKLNIMQHRITLSTDLLIAVRGKLNKPGIVKTEPAVKGIEVSVEKYNRFIASPVEEETHWVLYGMEHPHMN